MANELQKYATAKAVEITGRQFCSHCQTYKPLEGGAWKTTANGRRRWRCKGCKTGERMPDTPAQPVAA